MAHKSVLRIVLFASASLVLAMGVVQLAIDLIIESDVRDEMSSTLDALRTDVDLNFDFYTEYHCSLAACDVGDPERATEASLCDLMELYGFDRVRLLRDDGSVIASVGGGTNMTVKSSLTIDGHHSLEVGVNFFAFTQRYLGALMMESCCENWPQTIDGSLLCLRRETGEVISSSLEMIRSGDNVSGIFDNSDAICGLPNGECRDVSFCGRKSICLTADRAGFRYVAVVPYDSLTKYRLRPLITIGLVLLALVGVFSLVAFRMSSLTARLRVYIEGEKSRMREDFEAARLVQMSALPPPMPRQFAYSVKARMDPAKVVGGDFYDYTVLPSGNFFILVADVAGKGISAAMFMMRAKSVIKQCLAEVGDMAKGMTKANAILAANNDSKLFVTVWMGILNPRTGIVKYVNAGHNPPVIRRANGGSPQLEWVKCVPSLVMALMPGVEYPVHELILSPGDLLFLYTDGVTEAQNLEGKFFGEARLEKVLSSAEGDVIGRVRASLDTFQGEAEPADDVTMVALEYAGTPPGSARGFPCSREVGFVEAVKFLEEELEHVACPPDVRKKFLLAFDEIASNVISYSGAAYFTVKVAAEATPPAITLTVADTGKPFNPLDKAAPDLAMSFEKRISGGFGIFITRQLMDDVIYCRDEGRNVLTLRKSCPMVQTH